MIILNYLQMRRIAKISNRLLSKPLPIIRFDNEEHNSHLTSPTTTKASQANPSTIAKHSELLALSAAEANSVCLSSNQIGLQSRLIAIATDIQLQKEGNVAWVSGAYDHPSKFTVYQKPRVLSGRGLVDQEQESISFPFIHAKIKRYDRISVSFRDKQHQRIETTLEGPLSRVFQQSLDQLEGEILLDWRLHHGRIWFQEEMVKYFPKTTSVLQQFTIDFKKIIREYPQLIEQPQEFDSEAAPRNEMQNEPLPIESDFFRRLVKHYIRQMTALEQKIEKGFGEKYKWDQSHPLNSKIIQK